MISSSSINVFRIYIDCYEPLKINDSKTEFLIIRSPFSKVVSLQDFTIYVGESSNCCSETARHLGVNFDSAMNLESHIAHVCKIAYNY